MTYDIYLQYIYTIRYIHTHYCKSYFFFSTCLDHSPITTCSQPPCHLKLQASRLLVPGRDDLILKETQMDSRQSASLDVLWKLGCKLWWLPTKAKLLCEGNVPVCKRGEWKHLNICIHLYQSHAPFANSFVPCSLPSIRRPWFICHQV